MRFFYVHLEGSDGLGDGTEGTAVGALMVVEGILKELKKLQGIE